MEYLYCTLIGYAIGTINPSYLLARIRGFDIRKKGSGNAGASNALILFGKLWGVLCALFDIGKAYLAILLTEVLFPDCTHAFAVTGVACTLGHIFPFYMKFRGGKGLSCLGGLILRFDWRLFLLMLVAEVILVLIVDYICFVPITASVAFAIIYAVLTRDLIGTLLLLGLTGVIFGKHLENFRRIRCGTEMHLSYLWKPQAEMERMKRNLPNEEAEIDNHFSGQADNKSGKE